MKRTLWDSTSFTNYLFEVARTCDEEQYKDLQKQISDFHQSRRHYPREGEILSCVEFAKFALGKQNYTWTGSYRNWVWERGDWRLYVNNTQGFSFEVREGLSLEKALVAWDDVRARLGAHSPFSAGQRVLAYQNDEPGVFEHPDPQYPGLGYVTLDTGRKISTHFDNLRPA